MAMRADVASIATLVGPFGTDDRAGRLIAIKITSSGHVPYDDPQNCWDMKQPLIAAIKRKGRMREIPVRFAIVTAAMTQATMITTGQMLISRSALSEGSASRAR